MHGRARGSKILLFTPHPPLRVTLSLRERELSPNIFPILFGLDSHVVNRSCLAYHVCPVIKHA
jgi:hypothetical protein